VKTYELTYPISINQQANQVIVLGFFDGLHLGHQQVINTAKKIAQDNGIPLGLLTYYPHPSLVFGNDSEFQYLTDKKERESEFERLGVDNLYFLEMTQDFSNIDGQTFVDQILMPLNPRTVVAGFDHTYGAPNTTADMQHLTDFSKGRFEVIIVEEQQDNSQKISSTNIRKALSVGDLDTVTTMLGRYYTNRGKVIHGDARGRLLGYPTLNVQVAKDHKIPGNGVYITQVKIEGDDNIYQSMTSVGTNPTFEPGRPITVEVHVLNFDQDVYGKVATVTWIKKLRDQEKFDSAESLIEQLRVDETNTWNYFNGQK
jgi:riboflavin kinase/FMN adenylyltransferase